MENQIPDPVFRRLRGYAFDPSLSLQLDTVLFNETVFKIRWEKEISKGPIGEYIEVIDYDPASKRFYAPIDLNNLSILANDGISPSESNPFFHQQMVYAVAMTTIQNFERALGRRVLWAGHRIRNDKGKVIDENFVGRLRIYPHAIRQANAFYSPEKVSLLFGYFPASSDAPEPQMPGGMIFTCLSHDIVAHETTHALLDGMHRRFVEANHPDTLAFHEAFADIVALFQHFSFPEVLRNQISKTRGNLASQNILGELAQQFGKAIGNYGALRQAIGQINPETKQWELLKPNPDDYLTVFEPHARGSILVATIFDAFLSIYKTRVADLLRIATNGTGVLPDGEIHPDLVTRLSDEAAKTAQHILGICIRALDYCPAVDITFGDYLRAIITADIDVVPDDFRNYRIAVIEAFRRRGIFPRDVCNLSVESLCWQKASLQESKLTVDFSTLRLTETLGNEETNHQFSKMIRDFGDSIREIMHNLDYAKDRRQIYDITANLRGIIHEIIKVRYLENETRLLIFEKLTGLVLLPKEKKIEGLQIDDDGFYKFEVHSLRGARRMGPSGKQVNQIIVSLTQKREIEGENLTFRGCCTLILNLENLELQYIIKKPIDDQCRLERHIKYHTKIAGTSLRSTYFGSRETKEPFALLHGIYT